MSGKSFEMSGNLLVVRRIFIFQFFKDVLKTTQTAAQLVIAMGTGIFVVITVSFFNAFSSSFVTAVSLCVQNGNN